MPQQYNPDTWVDEVLADAATYLLKDDEDDTVYENCTIALATVVSQAGTALTAARMNNIEDGLDAVDNLMRGIAIEAAVDAGELTINHTRHILQPEAGTADDITFISYGNNFADNLVILTLSDPGVDTITFKHGEGNVKCQGGKDIILADYGLVLIYIDSVTTDAYVASFSSALDLVTATGDLIYATGARELTRLGIGTANQLLQTNAGATAPEWATKDIAGDVLTTEGDILYRDDTGLQRLAKGAAGDVLRQNAGLTAPEWGAGGYESQYIGAKQFQPKVANHPAGPSTAANFFPILSFVHTESETANASFRVPNNFEGTKPWVRIHGLKYGTGLGNVIFFVRVQSFPNEGVPGTWYGTLFTITMPAAAGTVITTAFQQLASSQFAAGELAICCITRLYDNEGDTLDELFAFVGAEMRWLTDSEHET